MINAEKIKPFIDYLIQERTEKTTAKELLEQEPTLTQDEKRLIYMYCYPRPLQDRELPDRVMRARKKRGPNARNGFLEPDDLETSLIIEAGKTSQYERFIKHLMHSYSSPQNVCQISGTDTLECPICGKKLRELNIWDSTLDHTREHLAFGSPSETNIVLCIDCLTQLVNAAEIIQILDPGYLDWTKRTFNTN